MNIRPGPPQRGEAPTYIWTWVDSHGYTNVETKAPPPHIQNAATTNATAYMTVAEHNRLVEQLRQNVPATRRRR